MITSFAGTLVAAPETREPDSRTGAAQLNKILLLAHSTNGRRPCAAKFGDLLQS
jgi:hypothetical protein